MDEEKLSLSDSPNKDCLFPTYLIYCLDGGYGWGKTGQLGYITVTPEEAEKQVKNYLPGGWMYRFVGWSNFSPRLSSNAGEERLRSLGWK